MKIDRDKQGANYMFPVGKTTLPVQRKAETQFEQELHYQQEQTGQVRMQELLREIDRVNTLLAHKLNLTNLMLFKKLVKDFLGVAMVQAYKIQKDKTKNRRGRTMLVTIKTVSEEMDQLITEFMNDQPDPVDILSSLDKIRGMLVDLMI
jgi:uncharacterized protein YaaR (DUF327 family)